MTHIHRKVSRAALLLGGALLGFHMLMSALSQAPLSPAKLRYYDTVSGYLDPYFTQNWMLFAPDPLMDDRGILARAKCMDGNVTDYHDVTTPFVEQVQDSRFFPPRMSRVVTASVQQLSNGDELLMRLRKEARNDKKPVMPLMPHEKQSQADAITFVSRFAMDHMPTTCGGHPVKVQIRMYIHELPPWSKRNNPKTEGKVEVQDFPWRSTKGLR
ncbi:DUF5819 family protein [Streptomyces sparsus]